MISKSFKNVAVGAALALTTAIAVPAKAGDSFHQEDLRYKSTKFVQGLAASYSDTKLSFVVHVGEEKMASAVYQVASYLDGQGEDVAFFLAPDIDNIPNTTYVEIMYDHARYLLVGFAHQDIQKFQQAVFEEALKAKNHNAEKSLDIK